MDETLMHCIDKAEKKSHHCDVKLPVIFENKRKINVGINIRPYAR